ncbi:MAG TPA: serine/threonine-protein kinase [Polyangiaceae bacterium]|jgi:serine/threonine-protein kinase|nr:serine/threonine-protein kinase [Polyangiaceae bacterium]
MNPGSATFAPKQRVGSYELLVEIGSGGTATVGIAVYRGAAGFERLVVVKRMHRRLTRDQEFSAMLLDEARLASSIRHANVVPVIDVVRTDDEVALVMEYVESVSLAQLIGASVHHGKKLHPAVVARILVDALTGLHEAHEAVDMRRQPLGIVHRDVSPENVIVGVDGVSRVIDFGIAKAASRLARTQAGVVKGKCSYMAPEQVDGQLVDRRCDVFSAGIVLWEALTGARLFRGDDDFDEMRKVMQAPVPPPSTLTGGPPAIDAVAGTALARPVGERFQTARAFAHALEQAVPPAPPGIIADHVVSLCGAELEARHARLMSVLGDEVHRFSTLRSRSVVPRASVAPAAPVAPAPIAATPSTPPRPAPPWPMLAVVLVVSVLLGAGAAFAFLRH